MFIDEQEELVTAEESSLTETPDAGIVEEPVEPEHEDPDADAPTEKQPSKMQMLYDWIEVVVAALAVVVVIFTFLFRVSTIDGTSMTNTLQDKEIVLVSHLFYTPDYGDIVAIQKESGFTTPIVKRVIAKGGDTIYFDFLNWQVTVTKSDGTVETLKEDYVLRQAGKMMNRENIGYTNTVYVPEGCVFVMGDNRNGSTDSRSSLIGMIHEEEIIGHVFIRVFPFSGFGAVD